MVAAWTTAAHAQGTALKSLSLEELAQIEVTTANKQPEAVFETPAAVYVITQEDIRRSGATTIPDVLRLAPGIVVNQSDANRWAVGVRGFADIFSKSVLVLIDGRSVYTPLVGGVHWAIQDVPLADIEQIEVIRGPGATVWGANAVNGVINIITKDAVDTTGLRGTLVTGNVEQGRGWVEYGDRLSDALHYRVYGKAFTRAAQFHADGSDFDEWRSAQSGFRADWRGRSGDHITVSGDLYRTRTGERADVTSFVPPATTTIDGPIHLSGGNVIARWERRSASGGDSRLQVYFDRTNRKGFTFAEVRNTVDFDFSMRHEAWRRQAFAWGAGGRVSPSTVTQIIPTLNFVPNNLTHSLASAFVQDEIRLTPRRLSLTLGTKIERNSYTGVEALPSARLLWFSGDRAFWASATRAVRTPSRFERDLDFEIVLDPRVPVFAAITGSAQFDSERVVGLEAGYRQLWSPTFYIDVGAYTNRYRGLAALGEPSVMPQTSPIQYVRVAIPFTNGVNSTTRGVEVTPDWKPSERWQLKGSYSFAHIEAENVAGVTSPVLRDNYIGLTPRHQVRVQSRINLGERIEADQTYRFVGALPAGRIASYHSVDARIGWRLAGAMQVAVVGVNLLQPHHREYNAVPVEIRRSGYVQLIFGR